MAVWTGRAPVKKDLVLCEYTGESERSSVFEARGALQNFKEPTATVRTAGGRRTKTMLVSAPQPNLTFHRKVSAPCLGAPIAAGALKFN